MALAEPPFRAERLPAAEAGRIERLSARAEHARSEAHAVIEAARRETTALRDLLRTEGERWDAAMIATADRALSEFLDRKRIERDAEAAARLLAETAAVRRDFDALTPWLTGFLRTAIERLVGEIGEEDVVSRLVARGVADLKRSRGIALIVHPDDEGRVEGARRRFPARFASVESVTLDAGLAPGEMILDGDGGFVDTSLGTGVDALIAALANAGEAAR